MIQSEYSDYDTLYLASQAHLKTSPSFQKKLSALENDRIPEPLRQVIQIKEERKSSVISRISLFFKRLLGRDQIRVQVELKNPFYQDALVKFYLEESSRIGIKKGASVEEFKVIKKVAGQIWRQSSESDRYAEFKTHMTAFFKGEHFIFNDEQKIYKTIAKVGKLRSSSHYDTGATNGKTGGPAPKNSEDVENAQYGLDGPQLKHVLVGRVSLAKQGETIHFGKTFEQTSERLNTPDLEKLQSRSWLQTESSPDESNIFKANFWKHRVFDFTKYIFLKKILHAEKPNLGPYGRGHGDDKPTMIGSI